MMVRPGPSELWFERLYSALHLPFWVGALVFGGAVFTALMVASGLLTDLVDELAAIGLLYFIPFGTIAAVFAQFGCRKARRGIEGLKDNVRELRSGLELDVHPLCQVRNSLAMWLAVLVITQPVYLSFGLPQSMSLEQRIIVSIPFFYWTLFIGTFLWVWVYSLYTIFKIGKL